MHRAYVGNHPGGLCVGWPYGIVGIHPSVSSQIPSELPCHALSRQSRPRDLLHSHGFGKVRPLATVLRKKGSPWGSTLSERALAVFMGPIQTPAWFGHVASSVVLHQDAGLLYNQYHNLRSKGYEPSSLGTTAGCSCGTKSYGPLTASEGTKSCSCGYTPNRVNKGIVTFRQWIETRARGGVPWSCDDILPVRGTEDVFNMKHAHTENCQYYTDAYRNLEGMKTAC